VNSLEENLKTEFTEISYSLEENVQSKLNESSEDISEPLLAESSVENNCCPASTESSESMEEISNPASTEVSDPVEENSKSALTEISDPMQENSKSLTEISDSMEESLKSTPTEISDSVQEELKSGSAEILGSSEENHKVASAESYESMGGSSKAVLTANLELMAENPKFVLPESVDSMETGCKLLPHDSSKFIDIDSDVVSETSGAVIGESEPTLYLTQGGDELTSSHILRGNSVSLTKTFDPTEENDTIPLHQRLLQSRNEAAINDETTGSGRVLRRSSAVSVAKQAVEPVANSSDYPKGDSNRVLRSSAAPRSGEPSLDQEVISDVDSGSSKSRSKANTPATRRTRLRKFSRRIREQMQEDWYLDPETLFYCRISGNIQENLLHHLDGKLEHEVAVTSRDWNRAGPSQPHTSVSTNQEEKHHHHHHHHRTPWEKFNFPKNYDGRCGDGAVCLASYIKDMSHLDISTQLTMQQNLKRLTVAPSISRSSVDVSAEISKDDVIGFSRGLCLNAKVCADRRRSLRSAANRGRDTLVAAPGGAASTFTARYKNCRCFFSSLYPRKIQNYDRP